MHVQFNRIFNQRVNSDGYLEQLYPQDHIGYMKNEVTRVQATRIPAAIMLCGRMFLTKSKIRRREI